MGRKTGATLAGVVGLVIAACGSSATGAPSQTVVPPPSQIPSVVISLPPTTTPAVASLASPTPTLPAEPTLVSRVQSTTLILYDIAVEPLAIPLDTQTATARAKQIGALVGLTDMTSIYQDPTPDWTWRAHFAQSWDGIPVADNSIELDLNPDGTVDRFLRYIGPRAPKPNKLITRAQAERAVPHATVSRADLEWDTAGTDEYHVVWVLTLNGSTVVEWGGAAWIDAGTGEVLQTSAIS